MTALLEHAALSASAPSPSSAATTAIVSASSTGAVAKAACESSSSSPSDVFVMDGDNDSNSDSSSADAIAAADKDLTARIVAADRRGPTNVDVEEFTRMTGVNPLTDLARDCSGNINHVPKDSVQFVADEYRRLREMEMERRKKILAELATPNPADYTYDGKLVPMPPLNFGQLAAESFQLAERMLVRPEFRCVRQCTSSDYFFEINDLYCEIAFVGRANAGKSSLINAVLGQQHLAKTSSVPGSTRTVNFYQSVSEQELLAFKRRVNPNKLVKLPGGGLQYTLVDVPGFGLDGMSERWRDDAIKLTDSYVGQRRSLNTMFMCIDAVAGVTPTDEKYFEWISNLHGVFWVVLTKCDEVPHSRLCMLMNHLYERITSINSVSGIHAGGRNADPTSSITGPTQNNRKSFRKRKDQYGKIYPMVLPVSAKTGVNIDFLRALLVETSGVLPANALRHILQKRDGAKWNDVVAEEKMMLEQSERERFKELEVVQRELAVRHGLLLPAPSAEKDAEEEEGNAAAAADDDNDDDGGVMSFDIPRMVPVSSRDDPMDDPDSMRRSPFKMNSANGLRRTVSVNLQQQRPGFGEQGSNFTRELIEKLEAKGNRHRTTSSSSSVSASDGKQQQQHKTRHSGRVGNNVLVEQEDGSLVESSYSVQRQRKKEAEQRRLQHHLSKMSKQERAAYMRHSGGTRVSGEALVDHTHRQTEVGAKTSMRRKDLSLRGAAQLDVSKASRLQTSSLPAGLWRQYGSANEGRINAPAAEGGSASSSVLGW